MGTSDIMPTINDSKQQAINPPPPPAATLHQNEQQMIINKPNEQFNSYAYLFFAETDICLNINDNT